MTRVLAWLASHWRSAAGIGAALLLAGVAVYARCSPTPTPATTATVQQTATAHSTTTAATVEDTHVVTTKPDGTRTERTTRRRTDTAGTTSTEVQTSAATTSAPTRERAALLGLTAATEWDALRVAPTGYRLGADVRAGELFGLSLRVGAEVHFPGNGARPNGAGLTLRVEIP